MRAFARRARPVRSGAEAVAGVAPVFVRRATVFSFEKKMTPCQRGPGRVAVSGSCTAPGPPKGLIRISQVLHVMHLSMRLYLATEYWVHQVRSLFDDPSRVVFYGMRLALAPSRTESGNWSRQAENGHGDE